MMPKMRADHCPLAGLNYERSLETYSLMQEVGGEKHMASCYPVFPRGMLASTSGAKMVCIPLVIHRIQPKNLICSEPNQTRQGSPNRQLKQVMCGN